MVRFVPENCFRLLFLIGLACLPMSVVTLPRVAVAAKMDVVLSPDELKDPQKFAAMQALLLRAESELASIIWLGIGLAIMVVSIVGLYSYRPAIVANMRIWRERAN